MAAAISAPPGGHADREHERGDRRHHRRFTDAHPQRWRHRDLCRGLGTAALTLAKGRGGQNTQDLIVSAFNLNGATVRTERNVANLSAATNNNPAGTLRSARRQRQFPRSRAPAPKSQAEQQPERRPGLTLTVNFGAGDDRQHHGGMPTLTLNDGGAATLSGAPAPPLSLSATRSRPGRTRRT